MASTAHPDTKYSLDALASAHFDEGKTSDLGALRDQHGGYDHIPVDDPSYRVYVQQDVHLTRWLADLYPMTAYGQREHQLLAIAGELSLRGFRVNTAALDTQLREQAHRREELQRQLPITEPLATNKGRQQLARAFAEHGVALPRSAGGFPWSTASVRTGRPASSCRGSSPQRSPARSPRRGANERADLLPRRRRPALPRPWSDGPARSSARSWD